MSAPPTPVAPPANASVSPADRVRHFWQRVSEGRKIDDLWSQFVADARASYGFYGRDVDWEEIQKLPRWRRPLHVAREFFWALLLKMSPARRARPEDAPSRVRERRPQRSRSAAGKWRPSAIGRWRIAVRNRIKRCLSDGRSGGATWRRIDFLHRWGRRSFQ